jgi:hypothetical protein
MPYRINKTTVLIEDRTTFALPYYWTWICIVTNKSFNNALVYPLYGGLLYPDILSLKQSK